MKSFKNCNENKKNDSNASNENENSFNPEEAIKHYSGKSEAELYSELLGLAAKGKKDGTLNEQTIDEFRKRLLPMLNEEQSERLNNILKNLI